MKKIKAYHFVIAFITSLTVIFCCYFGNYYHADGVDITSDYTSDVHYSLTIDDSLSCLALEQKNLETPGINLDNVKINPNLYGSVGFIFYPGAKVEYTAYEPMLERLAAAGINCYLIHMPFNFAIFNINAAQDIIDAHPEIEYWYIGGHSLGGAMAASFCADNIDTFSGLILCASTCTSDITNSDLFVLNIYGSNDTVLSDKAKNNNLLNLPSSTTVIEIQGGNHAYFGNYGEQKGDGQATVSQDEQQQITSDAIIKLINEKNQIN